MVKSAGRQVAPLLIDAGLGLLGYGAARMIANQAARMFPRKPTDTKDPFVLRMVGVVQFAAGAFLAIKVPKARGVGLGLCIAGLQDGIRRNVAVLAPYLGSDDETMLAYQPIEAPSISTGTTTCPPVDMGADDTSSPPPSISTATSPTATATDPVAEPHPPNLSNGVSTMAEQLNPAARVNRVVPGSAQATISRLGAGTFGPGAQVLADYLYDTVTLATGVQQLDFFSVPQGGAKTIADTNLTLPGQLPAGRPSKSTSSTSA
jgi:hypothetical protein